MEATFKKYDLDGSGLNTHELTESLQLTVPVTDYKYNDQFVEEVLKLVFDDEWESKQNSLVFVDFLTFMSEFEPIHYQVLDMITGLPQHIRMVLIFCTVTTLSLRSCVRAMTKLRRQHRHH